MKAAKKNKRIRAAWNAKQKAGLINLASGEWVQGSHDKHGSMFPCMVNGTSHRKVV